MRQGSLFAGSRLPLTVLLYLLHFFAVDVPAYVAARLVPVSHDTTLEWYHRFQDCVSRFLLQAHVKFEAGEFDIYFDDVTHQFKDQKEVELDETWLGKKKKYSRGTGKQTIMAFGIVERNGPRCVIELVDNNKKTTLLPLIQKYIGVSCEIHHDGLITYDRLHEVGYEQPLSQKMGLAPTK